jgi:hypothetical protein
VVTFGLTSMLVTPAGAVPRSGWIDTVAPGDVVHDKVLEPPGTIIAGAAANDWIEGAPGGSVTITVATADRAASACEVART